MDKYYRSYLMAISVALIIWGGEYHGAGAYAMAAGLVALTAVCELLFRLLDEVEG